MLCKVCHFKLGISKSTFSTTRLELGNIILPNIIILCVFVIAFLGISRFNHGGIRSHHIAKHVYSKLFFHSIFRDFKQKLSLNFSIHGGIRSHHIVKHLQLSVKDLHILAQGKQFALFECRNSVPKCP